MAEETAVVETRPRTKDEKGLLWFLSEMNLWCLRERSASAVTPVEAYDPERLARLRKIAATVGAGEATVLAAGIPAIHACLNGIVHPFAGEVSPPWNHVIFGLVSLWPLLVTTGILWWSLPKIEGDITASIAKNFALLRGLILVGLAAVLAAFEAALVPRFLSPDVIYSSFVPRTLAIEGYVFWRNFLNVLMGAAPWVLTTAILLASVGFLPIVLRAYRISREREIYEEIRGEV